MDGVLRFGPHELRPAQRELRIDGALVSLGARAFDVLVALAERRDRVVTKSELLELVWPGLVVEENNLQVQVGTLRKLLGANVISTIPGRGYRFTPSTDEACRSTTPAGDARSPLPLDRTPFVGREAELATAGDLLAQTRLLTLTGIGGSGKTRLALALARRVLGRQAQPAWFIDLSPLNEDDRVASAVAAILRLPERPAMPTEDSIAGAIGAAPALLLLDNCETALRGAAKLVDALLARCSGLCVLATSRVPLRVAGEVGYAVPPLALPGNTDLKDAPLSDAERLFVEQAKRVAPSLALDVPERRSAVMRICRGLDGLPLALELAAARVAVLGVAQIAERLDQRFRLLIGGSDRPARQQTMEAVLAWSWEHLSGREQRLLMRLSVFPAGCTLEAAACVSDEGDDELDVLDLLAALQRDALLVVDATAPGGTRYRLLDTVRAWAARELDRRGEAEVASAGQLRAMLSRVLALHRMMDPGEKYAALAVEIENLLAAHRWCGLDPTRAVDGLMLVAPLGPLFTHTGLIELGRTLLAEAVQRPASATATATATADEPRARALLALGRLHYFAGDSVKARVAFEQALVIAQQMGLAALAARLMADCADTYVSGGDPAVAVRLAADAVTAARQLAEDQDGLLARALVLNVNGTVLRYSGDVAGAEVAYQESLDLWRRLGDLGNEANTAMNLLGVRVLQRRDDGLDGLLRVAEAAWTKTGSLWVARQVLRGGAGIAGLRGQWRRALLLIGARHALEQRIHLTGTPAIADAWLPAARAALGDTMADGALADGASLAIAAAVALAVNEDDLG